MNNFDNSTIINMAHYILENRTTIRATAKEFNTPKSTVHHNLSVKLKYISPELYKEIKKLLKENFSIKHIHGGESTKLKYLKLKFEVDKFDEFSSCCND